MQYIGFMAQQVYLFHRSFFSGDFAVSDVFATEELIRSRFYDSYQRANK